jgi:hypothetical protein
MLSLSKHLYRAPGLVIQGCFDKLSMTFCFSSVLLYVHDIHRAFQPHAAEGQHGFAGFFDA